MVSLLLLGRLADPNDAQGGLIVDDFRESSKNFGQGQELIVFRILSTDKHIRLYTKIMKDVRE